jgi:hypothetical protein
MKSKIHIKIHIKAFKRPYMFRSSDQHQGAYIDPC